MTFNDRDSPPPMSLPFDCLTVLPFSKFPRRLLPEVWEPLTPFPLPGVPHILVLYPLVLNGR